MIRPVEWLLRRMHLLHSDERKLALEMAYREDRAFQRLVQAVEAQRAGREGRSLPVNKGVMRT